ncbi:acyl-[acyl-carrier-protein] thioesterase [Lachnobacterium bovis]|uniref:Acyl-ACP thioesterase n=1 Tax=Lachnobacterium bovis TaxID=140626 RepID=A0A1H9P2I7_9FIRM|nr:acyl-ACP thioesterase domain-containing protein [Lachnobacterium bovis]SER42125.1 Acyl-ACP thioesterase [Lachnobacterium bovis]
MFQMRETVNYTEIDTEKRLTMSALLDYFQNCSINHSEDVGVDLDFLKKENLGWIISSWQIKINKMPKFKDEIIIKTWPYEFKAFYGYRNFLVTNDLGEHLVEANSIWVLLNTDARKPVVDSAKIMEKYKLEPKLEYGDKKRKLKVPTEYEEKDPVKVPSFFIDTNGHMNNVKYVLLADTYLPNDFSVGELKIEYRKEAMLDDVLYPRLTYNNDEVDVVFATEEGKPYAILKYIKK